MKVQGRCHCGAIAFEAEVDPAKTTICHCTDCQMLSGTAYRTGVPADAKTFVLKSGTPRVYVKTAQSGRRRQQAFCADCGTPIYSAAAENPPTYTLRVGTLAQRAQIAPVRRIWCGSALPWSQDIAHLPEREAE